MVVETLIDEYENMLRELDSAISCNDDDLVKDIDSRIVEVFDNILKHVPASAEERRIQLTFLLEWLCPAAERNSTAKSVFEAISRLALHLQVAGT